MPLADIKYVNALIEIKPCFDQPIKKKKNKKVMEKLFEMLRNDEHTIGHLLGFSYHQNYYKFIGINFFIQTNTSIPQQINFAGKLEEDDGAAK